MRQKRRKSTKQLQRTRNLSKYGKQLRQTLKTVWKVIIFSKYEFQSYINRFSFHFSVEDFKKAIFSSESSYF